MKISKLLQGEPHQEQEPRHEGDSLTEIAQSDVSENEQRNLHEARPAAEAAVPAEGERLSRDGAAKNIVQETADKAKELHNPAHHDLAELAKEAEDQ
jgi:hypothetical protein